MREGAIAALRGIGARVRTYPAAAVGVGIVTLLVLAVGILPPLLAGEGEAENDVRSTLLQGLAGLVLAAGLYFTYRTLQLNREGQITERFTRAIDQLGSEKLDVRVGGIYALERIAKSSADDRGPIMEVLTAYVREHAPWPPRPSKEAEDAVSAQDRGPKEGAGENRLGRPSTDVQAVIAVLGRREISGRKEHKLDLSSADLKRALFAPGPDEGHFEEAIFVRARLEGAELEGVNLTGANLRSAILGGAKLMGADLRGAEVRGANLTGAKLMGADLTGADVRGANLRGAILTGAILTGAKLRGAKLRGANLTEANLTGANLTGANLTRANLTGAKLRGAKLAEAEFGNARYDSHTTWPAGFDPKAKGALLEANSE